MELGDFLWYDTNNNGLVDAGELPIAGVDVNLFLDNGDGGFNPATDTFLATQTTSAAGLYRFRSLAEGSYFVQVPPTEFAAGQPLAGYRNSSGQFLGDASNNRDHGAPVAGQGVLSELVTLTLGGEPIDDGDTDSDTNLTIDFGFYKLSLGNLVFDDNDNSGTFNAGDAPRGGVNVELLDGAGVVLQATVTDGSGLYLFTGLEPGDYRVRLTPPAGFTSSTGAASAFEPGPDPDNNVDNDDNGSNTVATITSAPVTLTPGAELIVTAATGETLNPTVDFGLISATLSLGNFVWRDNNNDGVVSAGEPGLDGVTVRLLSPTGTVLATQLTAGGGFYLFAGLAAGDYVVQVVTPAGYASSSGGGTEPASDPDNDSDNDDNGTAAGAVVASLPVTLSVGGEPTGDGDGNPNSNLTVDFGFVPTGSLSLGNLVWLDLNNNGLAEVGESGIQGVTVRLIAANGTSVIATTTTDVLGLYLFSGLAPGTYFVEVDRTSAPLTGYLSSTDIGSSASPDNDINNDDNGVDVTATAVRSRPVTLTLLGEPIDDGDADNNSNLSVDFGFVRALSLGNLVWSDANNNARVDPGESGIGGVTVRLIAADGTTVLATTTTDANGFYLFSGLQPGGYYVEVVPPPGGVSSTDIGTSANPDNDEDNDDNGVAVTATGLQSGLVTLGIGTEPTTDGDGNPDSNLTVDFGFVPGGSLSLGNLVWLDLNNNGVADAGEPGAPGVTVRLIAADGTTVLSTTTTGASGNYLFTNLPPGTYIVEVDRLSSAISGYLSSTDISTSASPDNDEDNDDNGVNVTAAVVRSNPITLSLLGEPTTDGDADANSNLTVDFGFVRTVSLGNLVWVDTNNNALVDAGERGRAGVTVRLLAADCVTVLATTLTDVNGNYLFSGLLPGTYCVSVVQPLGLQSSTDISSSANPNNDRNNDDNGVVVSAGLVRSGPVTLGFGLEPVDDGDTNPDSNLSVDFGFVPEQGGGFLADVCLGQTIPLAVVAGSPFTATYTADNRGPGVAENVVIDGMLPPGLFALNAAPSAGGTCTITPTNVDCVWAGGTPAGMARTVTVTFRTDASAAPGSVVWLWFMSHSSNGDPNPACDVTDSYVFVTDPASAPVDLVLSATGVSGAQSGRVVSAAVNSPVSARFTVTNTGAAAARGRYALLLDTANGIEVVSATPTRGSLGATNATAATWDTDLIPPGATAELNITFVPRSGTMWRIQAIRTEGAPADPNAANDAAEVIIDGIGAGGGRFVAAGNLDGVVGDEIVTGAGQAETPQVQVFSGAGSNLIRFFAFDPGFRGGVRVASCDINGDGVDELIAAQGPGGGRVRVLSLSGGYVAETVAFDPFDTGFTGGINVACGDVDGDGRAEVVVGPDGGRAPDVKVFTVGALSAVVTAQFQAYEPTFTGGVRVSVGRFAGSGVVGAFNI
ncbi:MAG: VCBS repeat-containing protein, partial [Acidobacteria bacterium]|nr:VCBS repeat-containing protein [Acidobacteriota bacterium]